MTQSPRVGPQGWASLNGGGTSNVVTGTQHPLYGTAQITGDRITVGNVTVEGAFNLNTEGGTIPGQPILYVTITARYTEDQPTEAERTAVEHAMSKSGVYHGGGVDDEIAALISLRFGTPCRSGGTNRLRLASTHEWQHSEITYRPQNLPQPDLIQRGLLPPATASVTTEAIADTLHAYANLQPEDAAALIRAARTYALGRWIVNDDPNETWLRDVSAIETVAHRWQHHDLPAIDILRMEEPDLADALHQIDPAAEQHVADEPLARGLRARRRFTQFLQQHRAPPPADRPAPHFQIPFGDPDQMERLYKKVYDLRSAALHNATPFPTFMLSAGLPTPTEDASRAVPSERAIIGISGTASGGHWKPGDAPITLAIWDHITRHAINNWWDHLTPAGNPADDPAD